MDKHFQYAHRVINSSYDESQKAYDEWSQTFDNSVVDQLDCRVPYEAAALCNKYFDYDDDGLEILDVAAGTALVGVHLREDFKFKGKLDILDANLEMLNVASKKKLGIRTIYVHSVNDNGDLPTKDAIYDCVFCIGSLLPNHLPPTTVKGMFNSVKSGGMLIINSRTNFVGNYNDELRAFLKQLQQDDIMTIFDEKEIQHFRNYKPELRSHLYVMKKL